MDFGYVLKKMFGTVTADEEQAHRASISAEQQQSHQLRQANVQPAAMVPERVMPGNALSERQQLLDAALLELNRQNGLRQPPPVKP